MSLAYREELLFMGFVPPKLDILAVAKAEKMDFPLNCLHCCEILNIAFEIHSW